MTDEELTWTITIKGGPVFMANCINGLRNAEQACKPGGPQQQVFARLRAACEKAEDES